MLSLTTAALLLSIDSMLISFALGACRIERRHTDRLALAFGLCDGAGSLVGLLLGVSLSGRLAYFGQWGAPGLMGAYAICTLVLAQTGRTVAQPGSRRGIYVLYFLPLLMSLDNLAASFELVQTGSPLLCAVVIGSVSGLVSLCGFKAGAVASELVRRFRGARVVPWAGRYLDGVVLLLAAVLLAI
jgi:putative Mn2+ efflux pump MntP